MYKSKFDITISFLNFIFSVSCQLAVESKGLLISMHFYLPRITLIAVFVKFLKLC